MRYFHVLICTALLLSGLLVFGLSTAHATMTDSDTLIFDFYKNGTYSNGIYSNGTLVSNPENPRIINEGKGEKVGESIDYTFFAVEGLDFGPTRFFYLVEPGTAQVKNGIAYAGYRSDKIKLSWSHEDSDKKNCILSDDSKYTVTVTLNSDQDPGTHDLIKYGSNVLVENGSLQNITEGLFSQNQISLLNEYGYNVDVEVASDVDAKKVPEPAMIILLGLGLLSVVAVGRKIRSAERYQK